MTVPAADSASYGAGVQSTAMLALAGTGRFDCPLFLFANVGADSEHPDSLRYFNEVARPYAEAHGIEMLELHRLPTKGLGKIFCFGSLVAPEDYEQLGARCPSCGRRLPLDELGRVPEHYQPETLYGRLTREGSRSLPIPVRMSSGAPGTRSCTADFKIRVVAKELQARGATIESPARVALGISVDEIERAKPGVDPRMPFQHRVYPLLDLGLTRTDCKRIIREAGLPVPGKSSCYFCPFHDRDAWRALRRDTPELWERACDLEDLLNRRRDELGKDHVYFTRRGVPLRETLDDQLELDLGLDGCDSGYCFT